MNYRHYFHAGNFGDVFKHWLLLALLEALTRKDKPLAYLETHAGEGLYPLAREGEAQEWRLGIGRLWGLRSPHSQPTSKPSGASAARPRMVLCVTQVRRSSPRIGCVPVTGCCSASFIPRSIPP